MSKSVDMHLVCFDNPAPPDYGGAIDMYYKAAALKAKGIRVAGHIFHYGRPLLPGLSDIFSSLTVYPRSRSVYSFISDKRPFIVSTRNSAELRDLVLKDRAPVLCEGIHTTAFLKVWKKSGKRVFVRTHNVEQNYYSALAEREVSLIKRFYYSIEAARLAAYENILRSADGLACIAQSELVHFKSLNPNSAWVSPFHGYQLPVKTLESKGYALLQGNFSVNENLEALNYFLDIFRKAKVPLCVAGKNPPLDVLKMAEESDWLEVVPNPGIDQMKALEEGAACLVLQSKQQTGIKLKLLSALFSGKPVLSNPEILSGTGLEAGVTLCETENDWIQSLNKIKVAKTEVNLEARRKLLQDYTCESAVNSLIRLIGY
jgi:hypothetical protein